MDLNEFEQAIINGEITDFEPYMHKQKFDMHRTVLARYGIEVDRIIKRDGNQAVIDLIEKGLETERYEGWKNHPSVNVREALLNKVIITICILTTNHHGSEMQLSTTIIGKASNECITQATAFPFVDSSYIKPALILRY